MVNIKNKKPKFYLIDFSESNILETNMNSN